MFENLKKIFKKKPPQEVNPFAHLSPKDQATMNGEPWVSISELKVDLNSLAAGSIELDWNDIFLAKLVRRGYRGKTDSEIVDQWFQELCRGIAMELYEQEIADPDKRADSSRREQG